MKSYECSVCGKKCNSIIELKECLNIHEAEERKENIKRAEKISNLKKRNRELVEEIKANNEELNRYGISTSFDYSISKSMPNTIETTNKIDEVEEKVDKIIESINEMPLFSNISKAIDELGKVPGIPSFREYVKAREEGTVDKLFDKYRKEVEEIADNNEEVVAEAIDKFKKATESTSKLEEVIKRLLED